MARTVAYLRVSTGKQDTEKFKSEIRAFCDCEGYGMPEWVDETASGRTHWRKRKIGQILEELGESDSLIAPEMSRIGRSPLETFTMLQLAREKGINVYTVKEKWRLDDSLMSEMQAMMFGMAARIEADFISSRTKEGLKYARDIKGKKLGRPAGRSKLDSKRDEITAMLKGGATQRFIARRMDCTEGTLSVWLRRNGLSRLSAYRQ